MTIEFTAFARTTEGRGASRRMRRAGKAPGILTPDEKYYFFQQSYNRGFVEFNLTTGAISRRKTDLPTTPAGDALFPDNLPANSMHHGLSLSGDGTRICNAGTIDNYIAIVDKAMAKDPRERFPTANEMAIVLQRMLVPSASGLPAHGSATTAALPTNQTTKSTTPRIRPPDLPAPSTSDWRLLTIWFATLMDAYEL